MKKTKSYGLLILAVMTLVLCFRVIPSAAESTPDDNWEFMAELYLWGASIGGDSASGSDIDIDFDDLLDDLEMGFMGAFAARKGRWAFVADVIYLDVKDSESPMGIPTSVELTGWVLTPIVMYNLVDTEQGSLNVLAGARYLYLDSDLRVGAAGIDDSGDVWDGIIGIRGRYNMSKKWYLTGHVDIGTGDSDFTWQALAAIGYKFNRFDVVAGYRYLAWNFDDNKVFDDLNFSGPMIGVKFAF